jgi:protein-S-isoprenylcysteine O-methyltransferase Ste14
MTIQNRQPNRSSRNRDNLAGEHSFTDIGQLILLIIFLTAWITDSFLFHYSVFAGAYVPVYIRLPVGIVILIISALLALSAHSAVFGKTVQHPALITDGVFSLIRHPMYLGSWLSSIGLMITTLSIVSAAVCIVLFVFYYLSSRYEEKLLLQKFGIEYQKYKERVPMFFPLKMGKRRFSM